MKPDIAKIRQDFPVLKRKINGKPLVYFDNACMSLRPQVVIDEIKNYYENFSSCAGRSSHKLSEELEKKLGEVREKTAKFIGSKNENEIVFLRNTTEAINLVANSFNFERGDIVLTTDKEHNSNLLPWQIQAERRGIIHKIFKLRADGSFDLIEFEAALKKEKVRLVSVFHVSNLDGSQNPLKDIAKICHKHGALLMVDGAQGAPHQKIDIRDLDIDFYAFSGHKMLGPSGTGVLFGKFDHLLKMQPFIVGGGTVQSTTYHSAQYLMPPFRFEAGLQNYSGILGFGRALDYLNDVGFSFIETQEKELQKYISEKVLELGFEILGPKKSEDRHGIATITHPKIFHHDIAVFLDEMENIMTRSGQFCDHSWFHEQKQKGAARISFYFYNTLEEAELLIKTLEKVVRLNK
jgi:cysteine desulfurase/selenocysteine lyase